MFHLLGSYVQHVLHCCCCDGCGKKTVKASALMDVPCDHCRLEPATRPVLDCAFDLPIRI